MAIFLLCIGVICLFFGTQILSTFIFFISHAEKLNKGPWDLPLEAKRRRAPQVFLMNEAAIETLIVSNAWGLYAFVSKNLWERWTIPERTAFLLWCASMRLFSSNLGRLFWRLDFETIDRNAALESEEKLAIVGVLEKAALERTQLKPGVFTGALSGLSLMGPSIFQNWMSVSERLKLLTIHLSKVEKAR